MSRTPARVTQADIARALRAIKQTDVPMAVEILPDGTIRLVPYQMPVLEMTSTGRIVPLEPKRRIVL